MKMNKKITAIIVGSAFALTLGLSGCASCSRTAKTWNSDISGGLNRTVTLYDNQGEIVKSWDGKIDLTNSEEEIMFDLNDKRVIIHGGIVVVEEN